MNVIVKSKSDCPWCVKAKNWLAANGIAYVEEIYDDFNERQAMYDSLGLTDGLERTVPKIVVQRPGESDQLIRTYQELVMSSGLDAEAGFD